MESTASLVPLVGVQAACLAVGVPRATFYRWRRALAEVATSASAPRRGQCPQRLHPRALSSDERQAVLDLLHSPRFCDVSPAETYATLLDEGTYLASERTMYRLLAAAGETGERRNQRVHPAYARPELLAIAPNEVWSWDITKLLGPAKWTYFYLYVLLDIYSRYVVGWMVAYREQATLAERLIAETAAKQGIAAGQLTLHADRGSSMTSKPVAFLLADLGITKTHSRPHVSNDNPYSEAQFKTLKYRPDFPARFDGIEQARARGILTGDLPGLLSLVQHPAPALWLGTAHPGSGSLRPGPHRLRRAPTRAPRRLCQPSRALRPPGPGTPASPHRHVD